VGASYYFVLLCNVFTCLSNVFFMTFNLLLVLIFFVLYKTVIFYFLFFINTKEFFS
jgi:hypothetical protein